jgi:flagellar motor switch protein FliG
MLSIQKDNRRQAVALLAALYEGEHASDLLAFMNDGDREVCEERIPAILDSNSHKSEKEVQCTLRSIVSAERFSGIAEIHPAWILEQIKHESPRIIGIIMRYLPSKQVRYVLKNLPEEVKSTIPNLVEAFAVPEPVLDVIKRQFERRFLPIHISKTKEKFNFKELYYLKGDELEALFVELGLREMAISLDGLSEKLIQVVLNRLSLKDAKRLHNHIQELKGVSREVKQQARFTVLEAGDDNTRSDELLMEIGLASLARAIKSEDEELFSLIRQKLSPKIAYILKRFVDERAPHNMDEAVEERRRLILSCIAGLARDSKIDGQWVKFFPAA